MDREWNDNQPIYRQLRDRVVAMILDGVLKEGDSLPSVRTVAAEYRVNPLTVLKGYQQLVDEGLVETKRGRGMFINAGARNLLMKGGCETYRSLPMSRCCRDGSACVKPSTTLPEYIRASIEARQKASSPKLRSSVPAKSGSCRRAWSRNCISRWSWPSTRVCWSSMSLRSVSTSCIASSFTIPC